LGRSGAIRAIIKDGVRRALGLHRKARAKFMPWALIAAAVIPAMVIVSLSFLLAGFGLAGNNPFASPARYFDMIGTLSMLFVALIAPTLLIPDRKHGVLEIYASRPVRAADYLLARATALALLAALFILIPQATLYIGLAALHVDGLVAGMMARIGEIPAILGSTVGYILGYGAPAFLVAVFVKRTAIASGVFVVGMVLSLSLTEAVPRNTEVFALKYLSLLSMAAHPMTVRDWLFGSRPSTAMVGLGLPPWYAAVMIVAFTALTAFVAHRRYRNRL
jgi:ABC-2 type transport system permease protein